MGRNAPVKFNPKPILISMDRIENILVQHPFFSGLDAEYFEVLFDLAVNRHFESNESIFEIGAEADRFFLVHSGAIALRTQFIAGLGAGTVSDPQSQGCIGMVMALLLHMKWHFNAEVLEPTDVGCLGCEGPAGTTRRAQSSFRF